MPMSVANELCYMKAPLAMVLSDEQYLDSSTNDSIWSRQKKKIPSFMIKVRCGPERFACSPLLPSLLRRFVSMHRGPSAPAHVHLRLSLQGGEAARNACKPGELPPLKHDWELEKNRFPLMPYWCTTMKNGKVRAHARGLDGLLLCSLSLYSDAARLAVNAAFPSRTTTTTGGSGTRTRTPPSTPTTSRTGTGAWCPLPRG